MRKQAAEVVCERPSQLVICSRISRRTKFAPLEDTADDRAQPGMLNFKLLSRVAVAKYA